MLFYHSTFKNSTSDLKSKGRENHIFWAETQQRFPGHMLGCHEDFKLPGKCNK